MTILDDTKREMDQQETLGEALEGGHEAKIEELASLHPIDYDRVRKEEAEQLGCQVGTLDKLVKRYRDDQSAMAGKPVEFPEVVPWPDPVDGVALLENLANTYSRYVVLPAHADVLLALWTLHTYTVEAMAISPYIAVVSPTPECGKSTLLRVMKPLTRHAMLASNISSAAIYRVIAEYHPTLLIDEMDTFAETKLEIRNVLNGGHMRGAHVIRSVGDDHETRCFDTYGAKALACIGQLAPTLRSRSIQIRLRRKKATESITKLPVEGPPEAEGLARRALRWAIDHLGDLEAADPRIPDGLDNRAADNWSTLFAIAERAGWVARAHKAAEILSRQYDDDVAGVMLLAAIKQMFRGDDKIHSETLVDRLVAIEDGPWDDWSRGKAITANKVAKLLAQFDIKSKQLRIGEKNRNGYTRAMFEDAWTRYLRPAPELEVQNSTTLQSPSPNALHDAGCRVVEVQTPTNGPNEATSDDSEAWAEREAIMEYELEQEANPRGCT